MQSRCCTVQHNNAQYIFSPSLQETFCPLDRSRTRDVCGCHEGEKKEREKGGEENVQGGFNDLRSQYFSPSISAFEVHK